MTCEKHENCSFFDKHRDVDRPLFAMLVSIYCQGPLETDCALKQHLLKTGQFPGDDIAPTGMNFAIE